VESGRIDGAVGHLHVKGMLNGDLAAILLTKQATDDGALLFPQRVPGDVVGDAEEDERVEDDLELGATPRHDEGVEGMLQRSTRGGLRRHDCSQQRAVPRRCASGWRREEDSGESRGQSVVSKELLFEEDA
jgi:hypothetical protein